MVKVGGRESGEKTEGGGEGNGIKRMAGEKDGRKCIKREERKGG